MKSIKLLFILLIAVGIGSCHKKEVFPDLAKEIEGTYPITEVNLTYYYYAPNYKPSKNTGTYNPKDSAQIGQITIQKVDALGVNIYIQLKRQSGEMFFEDNYYCELSRDIFNKGRILFTSNPNKGGAYIINDMQNGNNYINVGGNYVYQDRKAEIAGSFTARR